MARTPKIFLAIAILILMGCGMAMAVDPDGCLQPGDVGYNPKLPCETPVGPSGPAMTPAQLADFTAVSNAINDPNYGGNLIEQWNEALRRSVPILKDDIDMRVSMVFPVLVRMVPWACK